MRKVRERRVRRRFVYLGFGFPVTLVNVPMIRVRGTWTPDVDYNRLARRLLKAVALKPVRLTGNEVRFVRHMLSMTLERFAGRFGVTHPAVLKWEKTGDRPTSMTWALEKDIRLEVLQTEATQRQKAFLQAYRALSKRPEAKSERIALRIIQSA